MFGTVHNACIPSHLRRLDLAKQATTSIDLMVATAQNGRVKAAKVAKSETLWRDGSHCHCSTQPYWSDPFTKQRIGGGGDRGRSFGLTTKRRR
jgi:hypothetical protein